MGRNMRKPFRHTFASETVVANLIKLGYLKERQLLTNKLVRNALGRLQTELSRNEKIQAIRRPTAANLSEL
jgi:hypothetical protein